MGKLMKLGRDDVCVECQRAVEVGTTAYWFAAERAVRCVECYPPADAVDRIGPVEELVASALPSPPVPADGFSPDASPTPVERRLVACPTVNGAGVLRLHLRLARYKVAVLPLSKKDTLFLGHLSVGPGTPATASAANEGASRSAER